MAREVVVAVKSGNWSDPTVWNTGRLPESTDQVFANGFTVTIDQDVTVLSISNDADAPISTVPYMTGMTEPSGEVIFEGGTYYPNPDVEYLWPYQAFAFKRSGLGYRWYTNSGSGGYWLGYDFKEPVLINNYYWRANSTYRPKDFSFQGWDGVDWVLLHSVVGHSSGNYYSGNIGNTTSYNKYRIVVDVANNTSRTELFDFVMWYSEHSGAASAGGTFFIGDNVTITCTHSIKGLTQGDSSISNLIEHSGNQDLNINANIYFSVVNNTYNYNTINISGSAIVNVAGDLVTDSPSNYTNIHHSIRTTNDSCVFNFVGNMYNIYGNGCFLRADGGELNITGDISYGLFVNTNSRYGIMIYGSTVVNIVGDIYLLSSIQDRSGHRALQITSSNSRVYHTGGLYSQDNYPYADTSGSQNDCIYNAGYYNQIGIQQVSAKFSGCLVSNNSAINILSGPFLSSYYGTTPLSVRRAFLHNSTTYYEYLDSSRDGYIDVNAPDYVPNPTIKLISPDTVVDSPAQEDVREGTVYALGTYTGTLAVPAPGNVSLNVPIDNTVGTAILTKEDVWNVQTSELNTEGSIGKRLKNASTVQSTGEQLSGFGGS